MLKLLLIDDSVVSRGGETRTSDESGKFARGNDRKMGHSERDRRWLVHDDDDDDRDHVFRVRDSSESQVGEVCESGAGFWSVGASTNLCDLCERLIETTRERGCC